VRLDVWLCLLGFILFATFYAISEICDNIFGVFHSLPDLFGLALNQVVGEVFPVSDFVDVRDVVPVEEQFCAVLEDDLVVFGVKPEQIGFGRFAVFCYPCSHGVVGGLFVFCSFLRDDLFVVQQGLSAFFLCF
jgi:hypothetical protein